MPAVQPRPAHIKPVATQRNRVDIEARVPASRTAAYAVARVIEAASRNVGVMAVEAPGMGGDASLRCNAGSAVLRSSEGPLDVAHIRAFHPCLRAAVPGLDIVLVSPAAARPDASAHPPLLSARRSRDRAMVEYACRYAQRLQRKRVTVLPGPLANAARAPDWFDSLAAQFPDLTLDRVPVDAALGRLAAGDDSFDVLVVPAGFFSSVGAVASALSGTPGLVTQAQVGADAVEFFLGNPFGADDASQTTLEALLLGAAQLLVHTGNTSAGLQVTNAVLKALEDGLHSDGLKLLNPYTRRLDADDLASAVIERLGSCPSRLKPACSETAGQDARRPVPALRVVSRTR